jgi:hypothetical protein
MTDQLTMALARQQIFPHPDKQGIQRARLDHAGAVDHHVAAHVVFGEGDVVADAVVAAKHGT